MNKDIIAYAVGEIDDKFIKEAELPEKQKKERRSGVWLRFGAVAAAACIIAAVGIGMNPVFKKMNPATPPVDTGTPGYSSETESETEHMTERQTESETEIETEDLYGKGGMFYLYGCVHCGEDNWNSEYHYITNGICEYIWEYYGDQLLDWYSDETSKLGSEKGFDGIGEGSWKNIYDCVHKFNVPRDVFEMSTLFVDFYGYQSVLGSEQIDMIYDGKAEEFEQFFLNLGPRTGEISKRVIKLQTEERYINILFLHKWAEGLDKHIRNDIRREVNERFSDERFCGMLPKNTSVFSIPELIYMKGLTKEDVLAIGMSDVETECSFAYDIDSIFNEREKYEKLIADARALEDPIEMLKATRAINESLRK